MLICPEIAAAPRDVGLVLDLARACTAADRLDLLRS